MKANELRLNNYIKLRGNLCQIVSISGLFSESVSAVMIDKHGEKRHLYPEMQDIEGDELTEEWLLKFGFNNDYKPNYIGIDVRSGGMTTDFVLTKPLSKGEWQKYYTYDLEQNRFVAFSYVHELQNLYFAITGQELTFKTE